MNDDNLDELIRLAREAMHTAETGEEWTEHFLDLQYMLWEKSEQQ